MAFYLVVLAAVFDFLDGFAARLLKQTSPLGMQLDSLADMVTFGVVPTFAMIALYESGFNIHISSYVGFARMWAEIGYNAPFAIVACSALRLAKFNIDESQSDTFIGLPTPACALLCMSLGFVSVNILSLPPIGVAFVSLFLAALLVSPIRMFALKFKGFGIKGNEVRYGFVLLSAAMLWLVNVGVAIAAIITLYIVISILLHIFCKGAAKQGK